MEERLQQLGDPSGQQTSDYWNEWFSVVGSEHPSFEWYCDANEVARVLDYHLSHKGDNETKINQESMDEQSNNQSLRQRGKIIHPGAGNSLVPHKLRSCFPFYDHVVVDISPVALNMASNCLSNDDGQDNISSTASTIEFLVGNVLNPPLHPSLTPDSFNAWVDKGLVDALFDKEHVDENQRQCTTVFQEAHRLLATDGGFMLIVTLAEQHTMELILQNWSTAFDVDHDNNAPSSSSNMCRWSSTLHVWELVPISGKMRPFGIVLTKADKSSSSEGKKLVMHHLGEGVPTTTVHHQLDNDIDHASNAMVSSVAAILDESRRCFQGKQDDASQQHQPCQLSTDGGPYGLLATIEVKPYGDEVDLIDVCQQIISRSYSNIGPIQWVAWHDDEPSNAATNAVVVVPTPSSTSSSAAAAYAKIVPMAFGLSKLVLRCLVPSSDELDAIIEDVMEWHGIDCIQSIDVDWDATQPVGNVSVKR